MTVIAPTSTPPAPVETSLSRFVEELKARRAALQDLDWTPPGPPPEEPPRRDWKLRWDTPGVLNAADTEPISLEDLRKKLPKRMKKYLRNKEADHALLIKVAAGGGKTHSGIEVAQWAAQEMNWRILWAASRHNMFDQLKLMPNFEPELWYHWLPMHKQEAENDSMPTTCRYAAEQGAWTRKGYPAFDLCQALCGTFTDGHLNKCPYRLQAKQKERIIFGMHQHLSSGLAINKFDLVIVDELPLDAFIEERVITPDELRTVRDGKSTDLAVKKLLDELLVQIARVKEGQRCSGRKLFEVIGEALDVVYTLIDADQAAVPMPPPIWRPDEAFKAPAWFIMDLLHTAALELEAWSHDWPEWAERIWVSPAGLHILKRAEPWEHLPRKMIVLDATANPVIYRAIFDRKMKEYAPAIARKGELYQVVERLNGKSNLSKRAGKGKHRTRAEQALKVSEMIARSHRNKDKRVCVITYQEVESPFAKTFGEDNVEHFYNLRGTNNLETADCLIVFGTPAPPPQQVLSCALALDPQRREAFPIGKLDGKRFNPRFYPQGREYRVTPAIIAAQGGKAPFRDISGYWDWPELQAIYEQKREAELTQALHRSRINVRECKVWLLTSIPTHETLDGIWEAPPPEAGFPSRLSDGKGIHWTDWLELYPWLQKLPDNEEFGDEKMSEVTGRTREYIRRQKWKLVIQNYFEEQGKGIKFEATMLKKIGQTGRPPKGLKKTSAA